MRPKTKNHGVKTLRASVCVVLCIFNDGAFCEETDIFPDPSTQTDKSRKHPKRRGEPGDKGGLLCMTSKPDKKTIHTTVVTTDSQRHVGIFSTNCFFLHQTLTKTAPFSSLEHDIFVTN